MGARRLACFGLCCGGPDQRDGNRWRRWEFFVILDDVLTLFGEPRFDGGPVPLERVTYLLAILACRDEWVSRDELILLLWGDADETAGRQRLRQLLYRARSFPHASGLEADAARVRLAAPSDVRAFREAVRAGRWGEAASLYGGPLLQGVTLPDAPELEEFFAYSREEFAALHRRAALTLVASLEPTEALALLELALEREPLEEELLRECLRLAAGANPEAGRRAFERYARALRALDAEPDPELQALLAALETKTAAAPTAWLPKRQLSRLPLPTTAFIGRQTEVGAISERLSLPSTRLVTILGPGGAGKTRLSLEVAEQYQMRFPDGAAFVELAPVAGLELVPDAITQTLGLPKGGDTRAALLDGLATREMLLVLDNLEHLPGIAALIAEILERAPRVRLLVTTREALGLRAEHVVELQGMPAPDSLFPLETQDAALLFLRAAQRARPDFAFSGDLEPFTRIYRAVSGMPLGLELAASWVRVMNLVEIAEELQQSLDFLEVDAADMPERHRSFAAAFRSSWILLSNPERQALARMSVFRGGFTREMARDVTGASVPVLLRLVNKSLVSRRETRFFLHEMIRQYAERELSAAERETALAALSRTLLDLSAKYYHLHNSPDQTELGRRLEQEHDNIRSVLQWCSENDLRLGADLTGNLEHFWYIRGHHREGLEWAERYLNRPETAAKDELRLKLLWAVVSLAKEMSDYARSRAALDEYRALAEALNDQFGLATFEKFMGLLTREQGDIETGRLHLERALKMFEALGDRNQMGICWNDLGICHAYQKNWEAAKASFEQSLEIKREIGDRQGVSYALGNLGLAVGNLGDTELDRVLQEESLRIKRELGDAQGIGNGLENLGAMALDDRDFGLARAYFRESLDIFLRLGRRWSIAHILLDFANLEHQLGRYDAALRLLAAAEEGKRRIGSNFPGGSQKLIARIRAEHPLSEAERTRFELEGERMTLEAASLYALGATDPESDPSPERADFERVTQAS